MTLRTKAFCYGLMACDYLIKPPDGAVQTGDFSVRWYCGAQEKILRVQNATDGTPIRLDCVGAS